MQTPLCVLLIYSLFRCFLKSSFCFTLSNLRRPSLWSLYLNRAKLAHFCTLKSERHYRFDQCAALATPNYYYLCWCVGFGFDFWWHYFWRQKCDLAHFAHHPHLSLRPCHLQLLRVYLDCHFSLYGSYARQLSMIDSFSLDLLRHPLPHTNPTCRHCPAQIDYCFACCQHHYALKPVPCGSVCPQEDLQSRHWTLAIPSSFPESEARFVAN